MSKENEKKTFDYVKLESHQSERRIFLFLLKMENLFIE